MARPQKDGVDYFPVDVSFSDSVKLLRAEFGPVGVGILIAVWQRIYGEKGYYTPWDNDVALMFSTENGVGVSVVREVISACIRRGIFDREKFEVYGVLTSEGVQERYAEATERRTFQKIDGRYLLIPTPKNWIIVNNNRINVDNNSENADHNPQSKVKYSKVNNKRYGKDKNKETDKVINKESDTDTVTVPTVNEIMEVIRENGYSISADRFYEYYSKRGWRLGDGSAVDYKKMLKAWNDNGKDSKQTAPENGGLHKSFEENEFYQIALERSFNQMNGGIK